MGVDEETLEEIVNALYFVSDYYLKQLKKGCYSFEVLESVYLNSFNYAFNKNSIPRVNFKVPDIIYFNSKVIPLDLKRTLKTVKRKNFDINYLRKRKAYLQTSSENLSKIFESQKKFLKKWFEPLMIFKDFHGQQYYDKYKQDVKHMKLHDGLIITSIDVNTKYFNEERKELIEIESVPLSHDFLFLKTGSTYRECTNVLNSLIIPHNEYLKLKRVFEIRD